MFNKIKKYYQNSTLNFLHGFNWKRIAPIAALAIADASSFALPFYLKNVFPNLAGAMGISDSDYSQLLAIYGFVCIACYLPGGWMADQLNSKKLLIASLFMTGIVGFWYGSISFLGNSSYESNRIPSFLTNGTNYYQYYQLMIIYILWGISTVLLLWAPLWKILSQQGSNQEQGTVNGILGAINGASGALMVGIAYGVYLWNPVINGFHSGFLFLSLILSCIPIITAVFIIFMIKEKPSTERFGLKFDALFKIAKNYKIWLVALLVMAVYMYQTGLTFFIGYMSNSIKIISSVVFIAGVLRTYLFRFVVSPFAGKLADNSRSYILFISIGLTLAIVVTLIAACLPGFNTEFETMSSSYQLFLQILIMITFLFLGLITWCLVTNRWATITELGIEEKNYATATGFISLIALSPDGWFFQITSIIQKNHEIVDANNNIVANMYGNQMILLTLTGIALMGTIAGFMLFFILAKEKKQLKIANANLVASKQNLQIEKEVNINVI